MSVDSRLPPDLLNRRRFPRKVAGRTYPRRVRKFVPNGTDTPPNALTDQIEQVLRSRMVFQWEVGAYQQIRNVLDDYAQSQGVIRTATADIRQAVESLWKTNTEFQAKGQENVQQRERFLAEYHQLLSREISLSLPEPQQTLSAELEDMLVELAHIKLRDILQQRLHDLAMSICDLMDRLVDLELVGVVNFPVPTACDAVFYRDVIIQEELGRQTVRGAREVAAVHISGFTEVQQVRQEIVEVTRGRHVLRHGKYDMYLSEAKLHSPDVFSKTIPVGIKRFLDGLPVWLRQIVRIVDGKRRSFFIYAHDLPVDEWEEKAVSVVDLEEVRLLTPDERVAYCPLVMFGHYVLTGWGEEENVVEEARSAGGKLQWAAYLLLAVVAGAVALGQWVHPLISLLGAVAACLSVMSFVEGQRQHLIAENLPREFWPSLSLTVAWIALTIGVMGLSMGLVSGNPATLSIGGAALCAAAVFGSLTKPPPR